MSGPHRHDMIRELRMALGLPDTAVPKSPSIVWDEALTETRRLLAQAQKTPKFIGLVRALMDSGPSATTPEGISYCRFCDLNWGEHAPSCEWIAVEGWLMDNDPGAA